MRFNEDLNLLPFNYYLIKVMETTYDMSLTMDDGGLRRKAYEGALILFNASGLNRRPFDNEHHRRSYMSLYLMEDLLRRVPLKSLSSKMSNAELFDRANHDFVEAIDEYKQSRGSSPPTLAGRII